MAVFDAFSKNYAPGQNNLLKQLLGGGFESYIQSKVNWLVAELQSQANWPSDASLRLLDFGCGTGEFLRLLTHAGFKGSVRGCDISRGMLETAVNRWDQASGPPFDHYSGNKLPYQEASFDLIVSSCVFHHIAPADRENTCAVLFETLAPGGKIMIFEHNPFHPLTRYAVSRAPEDIDAVLLKPRELKLRLQQAGFSRTCSRAVLIFPPRLPGASRFDRLIGRLPIGAQYVVIAYKTLTSA